MSIKERLFKRTPPFFCKLRTIGFVLLAAGSATNTVKVPLPDIVMEIGSYLIVAGTVMVAVSQAAVKDVD